MALWRPTGLVCLKIVKTPVSFGTSGMLQGEIKSEQLTSDYRLKPQQ